MIKPLVFFILQLALAMPVAFAGNKNPGSAASGVQGSYQAIVHIGFTREAEDAIMDASERKRKTTQNTFAVAPLGHLFPLIAHHGERSPRRNEISQRFFSNQLLVFIKNLHTLLTTTFMLMLMSIFFSHKRHHSPF